MHKYFFYLIPIVLFSCNSTEESIRPERKNISESIYASGLVRSFNQYDAYAQGNGLITEIFVSEGDSVNIGDPILSISNRVQQLNKQLAELNMEYADPAKNPERLVEAELAVSRSLSKMRNDSILYQRQKTLWQQEIGSKTELELRELAYSDSKAIYQTAVSKYKEVNKQMKQMAGQASTNLQISDKLAEDYILRSDIQGVVYYLNKSKGEMVSPQIPLATIGDSRKFVLEMQVDEYDILKIKKGLAVLVSMESYPGQVFEATVTKIYPIMNERSKTFLVEAEFLKKPDILYPNVSFEANIILKTKDNALLIPRSYLIQDSMVVTAAGDTVKVKTGLKDYQQVEILSGITEQDELIKPKQ